MRKDVAILLLLALVAALAWWASDEAGRAPDGATVPARDALGSDLDPRPAGAAEAGGTPGDLRTEVFPVPAEQPIATAGLQVVGRCIDEAGRALPGCRIELSEDPPAGDLRRAELLGHPQVVAATAATTCADDGRFALTIARGATPLLLRVTAADRVEGWFGARRRLDDDRIDVGDLELLRGVRVRGRVENSRGAPEPGLRVSLLPTGSHRPTGSDRSFPSQRLEMVSGPDGSLPLPERLPARDYGVVCRDREALAPDAWSTAGDAESRELVVVVRPRDEVETIEGVVVDSGGAALADVIVELRHRGNAGAPTMSAADGRFVMQRWRGDASEPRRLTATRPGYRSFESDEPVAWGARDLRIVLRRAQVVELTLVERGTGRPVEDFGVRVQAGDDVVQDLRSWPEHVTLAGRHPGGVLRLPLDDGHHRIFLQPIDDEHAIAGPLDLLVADDAPRAHLVETVATVDKRFRVVTAAGAPIVGSRVDLQLGDPAAGFVLDPGARAVGGLACSGGVWAAAPRVRVARGITDQDGEQRLRVAVDEPMRIEVRGDSHTTFERSGWDLSSEPEPIVIAVGVGATVVGALRPPAIAGGLRRMAGLDPEATDDGSWMAPAVQLVRTAVDGGEQRFPVQPTALGRDAGFRLENVPPGDWEAELSVVFSRPGQSGGLRLRIALGGIPGLREAEVREVAFDVAPFVPGVVRGRVLENGVPRGEGERIGLRYQPAVSLIGSMPSGFGVKAAAGGAFELVLFAGTLRVGTAEPVEIRAGEVADAVFAVETGSIRVRGLRAGGSPVAGLPIVLIGPDGRVRQRPTDDAGTAALDRVEVGRWKVAARPFALREDEAWSAALAARGGEIESVVRQVEVVDLRGGQVAEVELTAEVGY